MLFGTIHHNINLVSMSSKEILNPSSSIFELSRMLHEERNHNSILKKNISSMKVNLHQERLRVQHLQMLNEKLKRQHKSDIKKISALEGTGQTSNEDVFIDEFGKTLLQENLTQFDIENYENLIKILQDQVETLMNEREAWDNEYMHDFVECQTQIDMLNSELANMETFQRELSDSLMVQIADMDLLKEENKRLRKNKGSAVDNISNSKFIKSKNSFLIAENGHHKKQIEIMERLVNRLKTQRTYLLGEIRILKNKLIQTKEHFDQKIYRLTKEMCSLRNKHKTLENKGQGSLKSEECTCLSLDMKM